MFFPSCTRKDNKIVPRVVGVLLSGTPLLAEASLRSARSSGTSLSGILMLAGASLHGASLGGALGLATGVLLRGISLSDTLLLPAPRIFDKSMGHKVSRANFGTITASHLLLKLLVLLVLLVLVLQLLLKTPACC
jgi:hypothetical protein